MTWVKTCGPIHSLNHFLTKYENLTVIAATTWGLQSNWRVRHGENYYPPLLPRFANWLADVLMFLFCWLLDQLNKLVCVAVFCSIFSNNVTLQSKNLERCTVCESQLWLLMFGQCCDLWFLVTNRPCQKALSHQASVFNPNMLKNPVSYVAAAQATCKMVQQWCRCLFHGTYRKVCTDSLMTASNVTPSLRCWQIPICQSHPPRYSCCFNTGTSCSFVVTVGILCDWMNTSWPQSLLLTRRLLNRSS